MKRVVLLGAICIVYGLFTGCENDDEDGGHSHSHTHEQDVPAEYANLVNPLANDADAQIAGEFLFATHCSTCHGPEGKGDGPTAPSGIPDWTVQTAILTASDGMLYWHIADGLAGTDMPAWKNELSEDEIWQLITFLRTI